MLGLGLYVPNKTNMSTARKKQYIPSVFTEASVCTCVYDINIIYRGDLPDVMTTIIAMRSILEGGKTCEPTSTSWEDNLLLINYNFVAWSGCSNALYFQSVLCWIWIRSVQCWLIITLPLPSPLPIPNHQLPHLLCTFHFPAFSLHISIIVTFPADFVIIPCIPPLHPSPTSPTVYVDMPFPSLPQALP